MAVLQSFAVLAMAVIVIFAALNALAALIFRLRPQWLSSPQELMRYQYINRFDGELRPYVEDWFELDPGDWPAFADEYRRHEVNIYAYDPLCEYKHPPRNGRFINISGEGFRHGADQAAWPPEKGAFNIFFFGGSTTLNVGPDWTCIPSYLQQLIAETQADRRIAVYNFGRGAYFSSLEKALYFKLLSDGFVPDLVIFLDGINDAFFHHGLPATHGVYANAIDEMNTEIAAETRNKVRARPKWNLAWRFVESLPLLKATNLLTRRMEGAQSHDAPPLDPAQVNAVIERWLANKTQVEAVSSAYGVPALFVWQPSPAYKYDLTNHVALPHHGSMHGHERAGDVYRALAERLGETVNEGSLVWLADIQEGRSEPLYVDTVHYTAPFCRAIASEIASAIQRRKLIA